MYMVMLYLYHLYSSYSRLLFLCKFSLPVLIILSYALFNERFVSFIPNVTDKVTEDA